MAVVEFDGETDNLWNVAANWDPDGVPLSTDDASITNGFNVALNATDTVLSLTVGAGGNSLSFNNGFDLTVTNGVVNNGDIFLNSTGSVTDLALAGGTVVSGSGQITLGANSLNRIRVSGGGAITSDLGHTISGDGQILANTGNLVNNGVLTASGAIGLIIDPAVSVINNATISATGSGGLTFNGGTYINAGSGTIEVGAGSALNIGNSVIVDGGEINVAAGGVVNQNGSSTGAVLNDVTVNGDLLNENGESATVTGTFEHNNGTWSLNGTAATTEIGFDGTVTINGNGSIVMSDSLNNRITTNNTVVKIGADYTIAGSGQLLANLGGAINQGTIEATGTVALTIDPNALGFTNMGTMTAMGPGGFIFSTGVFTNTGAAIDVLDGSKLDLGNSLTVDGGTINTFGTGVINQNGSGTGAVLNDVVVNGNLVNDNGEDATVTGSFEHNDGTWSLNSTAATTEIGFDGGVTINGNGSIVMSDALNNRIVTDNTVVTIGANYTVEGSGQLLANTGGAINLGTIEATGTAALIIDPNGLGFTNMGTMTAMGTGGFVFSPGVFTNTGAAIDILDGSKLDLGNSVTVDGGTINTFGTGVINQNGSGIGAVLNDVTVNGNLVNDNGEDATVTGSFEHNNGTWSLNSTAATTEIGFNGGVTINGNGSIVMSDAANNRIVTNNTVVTIGADYTVEGAGQLLANTGGAVNQGTIDATGTVAITIDPNGLGFVNEGTMNAIGTGGFSFNAGVFTNTLGEINVEDGSNLTIIGGVTVSGGVINTFGSGVVQQSGSVAGATLRDITVNGTIVNANSFDATVAGTVTHNGIWQLNSIAASTDISFIDGATINGTGSIVMSDAANNRILTNNTVMTIGSDYTVEGRGMFLANTGGAINMGTLRGNAVGGPIVVDASPLLFDNQGTVEARDGGEVRFVAHTEVVNTNPAGDTLTGGTWNAFAGSTITLTGAAITTNNADVKLSGAGSTFAAIDSIVTVGAAGAFRVDGGRVFDTAGNLANSGTVEVSNGGRLNVTGIFTQTGGETVLGGGTLDSQGGAADFQGGMVSGSGDIVGGAIFADGVIVDIGTSPGIINVVGNTLLDALFQFELDGLLVDGAAQNIGEINTGVDALLTDFDQFNVFGEATLGANLVIDVVANFVPDFGDFFDIVTADSFVGTLGGITLNLPTDFEASIVTLVDPARGGTSIAQAIRLTYVGDELPPVETSAPGVLSVAISGLIGMGVLRRRRKVSPR